MTEQIMAFDFQVISKILLTKVQLQLPTIIVIIVFVQIPSFFSQMFGATHHFSYCIPNPSNLSRVEAKWVRASPGSCQLGAFQMFIGNFW